MSDSAATPPRILSFIGTVQKPSQKGSSLQVTTGTAVTLIWKTADADGVELTDSAGGTQKLGASGSTQMKPTRPAHDYTLTALMKEGRSLPEVVHVSLHDAGDTVSPHAHIEAPPTLVWLALQDPDRTPRSGLGWTIEAGDQKLKGKTDASGELKARIAGGVSTATLTLQVDPEQSYQLLLGVDEPDDEPARSDEPDAGGSLGGDGDGAAAESDAKSKDPSTSDESDSGEGAPEEDEDTSPSEPSEPEKKPKIAVPGTLDFAKQVKVGESAAQKIAVENKGDGDLVITAITFPTHFQEGSGSSLSGGGTVKPGASSELEVNFAPTAGGDLSGDLNIQSNDPGAATAVVKLTGKALAPWKLTINVTSTQRAAVGASQPWPEGEITINASAAADTHETAPVTVAKKTLTQGDNGAFTLAGFATGTEVTTLHLWGHTPSCDFGTRGDVAVTLNPGDDKTVDLVLKPLVATVSWFRGTKALAVIPFSTTDVPATLDAALPDEKQGVSADGRPDPLNEAFTFPPSTKLADDASGNADPALFRLRVTLDAAPEVAGAATAPVQLKVLTSTDQSPSDAFFGNQPARKGSASHPDGMALQLTRASPTVWESPYMRVVTSNERPDNTCTVVHSTSPVDKPTSYPPDKAGDDCAKVMDAGKQFGRKLVVEGTLSGAPIKTPTVMGGEPYARVPVRFRFLSKTAPTNKQQRIARIKVHHLNAWWAGQGLEFVLADPTKPLEQIAPPPRRTITIGEHTGKAKVSTVDFRVDLKVKIAATGKAAFEETIQIAVPKDKTPAQVAAAIKDGVSRFRSAHGDNSAVTLDADLFEFDKPRVFLEGAPFGSEKGLARLGTHGPADVLLKATGIDSMEISGVAVVPGDQGIDLFSPPTGKPFHDAFYSPPAASERVWARTYAGGVTGDHVAFIIEADDIGYYGPGSGYPKALAEAGFATIDPAKIHATMAASMVPHGGDTQKEAKDLDNSESKSRASTLLNFGRWGEAAGNFIVFLAVASFATSQDDVQHEMGHTLADVDHTLNDPDWFYKAELMHTGSAQPSGALKITRHKIHVANIADKAGTWSYVWTELAKGYGGAARDRIAKVRSAWVVNGGFNNWS